MEVLSKSLGRMGSFVDGPENGMNGIKKIDRNDYCLIFTDYLMPDTTGKDVLEHSKKNHTGTPVVGMSGTPWLLQGNGFDAVLAKPFSLRELKEVTTRLTK